MEDEKDETCNQSAPSTEQDQVGQMFQLITLDQFSVASKQS